MGLLSSDANINVELISVVNRCFKIPYFMPTLILMLFLVIANFYLMNNNVLMLFLKYVISI